MRTDRRLTLLALATSGLLWGTTVPLTKVALTALGPAWLTVLRFAIAAVPLALLARRGLRAAITRPIVLWGAAGYGAVIVLQNAGIARTSVTHSALILGAMPVLTVLIGVLTGRGRAAAPTWTGLLLSLAGIGVIAGHGGGQATLTGDALVGASTVLSAAFLVAQPGLLAGRSAVAVTAVQLAAGALTALPAALLVDNAAGSSFAAAPMVAAVALAIGGTLIPFTLFAYGQARVSPTVAGAFVNLEPLVGYVLGVVAFGEAVAAPQVLGGAAVLVGIAVTSLSLSGARVQRPDEAATAAVGRPVGGVADADAVGGAVAEAVGPRRCRAARALPEAPVHDHAEIICLLGK